MYYFNGNLYICEFTFNILITLIFKVLYFTIHRLRNAIFTCNHGYCISLYYESWSRDSTCYLICVVTTSCLLLI